MEHLREKLIEAAKRREWVSIDYERDAKPCVIVGKVVHVLPDLVFLSVERNTPSTPIRMVNVRAIARVEDSSPEPHPLSAKANEAFTSILAGNIGSDASTTTVTTPATAIQAHLKKGKTPS